MISKPKSKENILATVERKVLEREEHYICKICGRPNPEIFKKLKGEEAPFEEYLEWTKEQAIEHIKKEHPEIAKECEE